MATETLDIARLDKMANMLKAIAHPTRVGIINLLKDSKWLTVTEIHSKLGIEQAVASQQLAVLKNKGVLESRREGKNNFYGLKYPQLVKVIKMIEECQDC